jgi:hypothetical protein
MSIEVNKKGQYETFETAHHHKILVLDNREYFAWIRTSQGELLVLSDQDHEREKTLHSGEYVAFTPHDEPEFNDEVEHLALGRGNKFEEFILPNGLPTESDKRKKIVTAEEHLAAEKIRRLTGTA